MKLHLGPDIARPTIAATLTPDELCGVQNIPGAAEATASLTQAGDLTVAHDTASRTSELTFLLRRICRRPEQDREASLRSVIELIDTFSQFQTEGDEDPRLRWVVPGSADSPRSKRLGLQLAVRWPSVTDERVRTTATCVMRGMATELRYGFNLKLPKGGNYGRQVQALIDREGTDGPAGVILQTNRKEDASLRTDDDAYEGSQPNFTLTARNFRIHKQQLIGLAGGVAIAYADELV